MLRATLMISLGMGALVSTEAMAQQQNLAPESATPQAEANLAITAKAGRKSFQASGAGSCKHAPDASIGGASASLWTVQYGGGDGGSVKQLNLTLWRPKDGGPDQLSLSLETKSGEHRIETGGEGKHKGEGKVAILPSGPGGRLELTGKDEKGKPIQVTVDCPSFGEVEAEGD